MPARSVAQQQKMAICLHNPQHAKGTCPSPKVAREFATSSTKGLPEHVTPKFKKLG